jgi:cysteine desulfurase
MATDESQIAQQRDYLQSLLQSHIPNLVINGDQHNRLAGNLHIAIPGIPNSAIIARVRHHLAIATGSACTSGTEAPSHVLRAMGLPSPILDSALRLSLGKFCSDSDLHPTATLLHQAVQAIHSLTTGVP